MENAIQQVNPFADPLSPFFLHPSEHPGLVLVASPLTESNYSLWCKAMTVALELDNNIYNFFNLLKIKNYIFNIL